MRLVGNRWQCKEGERESSIRGTVQEEWMQGLPTAQEPFSPAARVSAPLCRIFPQLSSVRSCKLKHGEVTKKDPLFPRPEAARQHFPGWLQRGSCGQPPASRRPRAGLWKLCPSLVLLSPSFLLSAGSCWLMMAAGNGSNLTEVWMWEDIRAVVVSETQRVGEGLQTKEREKEHREHSYTKERLG